MRAGNLRSRVTIQSRSSTPDSFGEQGSAWQDVATVWASVEPLSGRELLSAQQVQGEISHRVRCRFRSGVTTAHRLLFAGRVLDIQAVINPQERGVMLEILCREGPTDG